jgi:stage II sporulation protein AA (anti-sigma F factor antagonist)
MRVCPSFFSGGEFVDVSVINHGTATVIRLRGSLKLGNGVEDLTKTFDQIFQQGQKKVVLSIAEVPMVDSSGIGLLVRSHTHCVKLGGGITLVQPSKFVIQTLQLVGVLKMFPVVESEEQGLA